ncbi:perlucin-like [Mytilus galloprovincialis]|uniref:perlucin-like n=1 Tax=Mytilus galloprovincialis TaxID=29158 RepID=UPI003F7C843A
MLTLFLSSVVLFLTYSDIVNTECPLGWHHYGSSCFFFSTEAFNWLDAESSCRAHNARLAEVQSKAQSDYLINMSISVGPGQSYWLGARDDIIEGTWIWASTDEVVTYTNWFPGEPNGVRGENCLHMYTGEGLKWNDVRCTYTNRFICEKEYPGDSSEIIG